MAEENQDGQEKTEQPTAKRLDDSKKKGQIARSKELNTMAITLIGGIALVSMSSHLGSGLWDLMSLGQDYGTLCPATLLFHVKICTTPRPWLAGLLGL